MAPYEFHAGQSRKANFLDKNFKSLVFSQYIFIGNGFCLATKNV